jgi:hypothetical protein
MKGQLLPLAERLAILQREDGYRTWRSVDDRRVCIFCDRILTGRNVLIRRAHNGSHHVHCPTRGCPGTPREWVYPGNPFISETAYQDWWRALGQETKPSTAGGPGASLDFNHA